MRARIRIHLIALVAIAAVLAVLPITPARADTESNALASWTTKSIDLPITHVQLSPLNNTLLATVDSSHPSLGNQLIEIDPQTGIIQHTVYVGSHPSRIAVSHDGMFAYIALRGASAITMVDLFHFAVVRVIPPPSRAPTFSWPTTSRSPLDNPTSSSPR